MYKKQCTEHTFTFMNNIWYIGNNFFFFFLLSLSMYLDKFCFIVSLYIHIMLQQVHYLLINHVPLFQLSVLYIAEYNDNNVLYVYVCVLYVYKIHMFYYIHFLLYSYVPIYHLCIQSARCIFFCLLLSHEFSSLYMCLKKKTVLHKGLTYIFQQYSGGTQRIKRRVLFF